MASKNYELIQGNPEEPIASVKYTDSNGSVVTITGKVAWGEKQSMGKMMEHFVEIEVSIEKPVKK